MPESSLNILDLVQKSIEAGANKVMLEIIVDLQNMLTCDVINLYK